jgi:hypothetical protein
LSNTSPEVISYARLPSFKVPISLLFPSNEAGTVVKASNAFGFIETVLNRFQGLQF